MRYGRSTVVALLLVAGCAQQTSATSKTALSTGSGPSETASPSADAAPSATASSSAPSSEATAPPASDAPDPSAPAAPFLVAAPLLLAPSGPAAMPLPPCTPGDIKATATTRRIIGGVAGVLTLDGANCALHIAEGPTKLLGGDGHALAVTLDASTVHVNPPENPRADLPLATGHALWGFTWTGSWCGEPAVSVLVPMKDDPGSGFEPVSPNATGVYGDLRVPVTGPHPACTGSSHSVLRPGVDGWEAMNNSPAEAVLPAPPEWTGLHARITIPATVTGTLPTFTLTLSNATGDPITLSPCPAYGEEINVDRVGPGYPSGQDGFEAHPLPCPVRSTLAPHASVTLRLPGGVFDDGSPRPYQKGSVVTVKVGIAGVATATATAHVG